MKNFVITILFVLMAPLVSLAGEFSAEALVGKWQFVHYADAETPKHVTKIDDTTMEFKANGELVTYTKDKVVTEHYVLKENSIIYKGKRGEQIWKIVSFTPDKGFVVNQVMKTMMHMNIGTLMTFEKR